MATSKAKTKLSIAAPAPSFKKEVELTFSNGAVSKVIFDFKYRTREEFAQLEDDLNAMTSPEFKTNVEAARWINQNAAEHLLKIATGWDLVDPFTKETLAALFDRYPRATFEINSSYAAACNFGRIKN